MASRKAEKDKPFISPRGRVVGFQQQLTEVQLDDGRLQVRGNTLIYNIYNSEGAAVRPRRIAPHDISHMSMLAPCPFAPVFPLLYPLCNRFYI